MIDRESRHELAFALRQLASGLVTNDEFHDSAFDSFSHRRDDPALAESATYGWLHYDDFRTYRLRGRDALSREERKSIARAVLFLKTDQEYVFGKCLESGTVLGGPWLRGCLIVLGVAVATGALTHFALNTFLFGFLAVVLLAYLCNLLFVAVLARVRRRRLERAAPEIGETFWPYIDERAAMEQYRYWPFADKATYETALANPPYLHGRRFSD